MRLLLYKQYVVAKHIDFKSMKMEESLKLQFMKFTSNQSSNHLNETLLFCSFCRINSIILIKYYNINKIY